MKKSLILKHVAHELAKFDEVAAMAKVELGDEAYLEIVRGSLVSDLPRDFMSDMEAFLRKRFGFKKHKCVFTAPTVGQWVADLTGEFSEDDVYDAFVQRSGVSDKDIRTKTYGDNILDRPFLEEIVEMLEDATGKRLTDERYLTNDNSYAYADIAKFFAMV